MTLPIQDTPRPTLNFTATERSVVGVLAGIYTTRMLGLFLFLPVLSLYVAQLPGTTPRQVGLAMGAYPLVQAALQIPFGRWSDRYGRRPVIVLGLVMFLLGSIVGALTTTLAGVIAGRAIQGAGAISAAITALLADHTRDALRTRAMAFIGISIGASFVISLAAAPALDSAIGVRGIFWVMALMAAMGLALLRWGMPMQLASTERKQTVNTSLLRVAVLPQLRGYFMGVFALHFILSATFLSVPQILVHVLGIAETDHWRVYLGVFLVSLLGTYGLIRSVERTAHPHRLMLATIVVAAGAQASLYVFNSSLWPMLAVFTVFFAMFNFLETRLPAALSKAAPGSDRGAALGVFATLQSLGSFCGPVIGGQVASRYGYGGVFWLSAGVGLAWAVAAAATGREA